jgi:hypothetical protein
MCLVHRAFVASDFKGATPVDPRWEVTRSGALTLPWLTQSRQLSEGHISPLHPERYVFPTANLHSPICQTRLESLLEVRREQVQTVSKDCWSHVGTIQCQSLKVGQEMALNTFTPNSSERSKVTSDGGRYG